MEDMISWTALNSVMHVIAVLIALVAAVTDYRTGLIPNLLTYPAILLGPVAWGLLAGQPGLFESVGGLLMCGLAPAMMYFWKGAPKKSDGSRDALMKMGDVKLFVALGAFCGPFVGIEAQFYGMVAASLFGVGLLAWKGRLFRSLSNSFFVMFNPLLPKRWRREIRPELLHKIRMGPFIFVGTLVAVLMRHPEWYLPQPDMTGLMQ